MLQVMYRFMYLAISGPYSLIGNNYGSSVTVSGKNAEGKKLVKNLVVFHFSQLRTTHYGHSLKKMTEERNL